MNLILLLACRPAADVHDSHTDSAWVYETGIETKTDDSEEPLGAFDLLVSIADDQKVVRLHFPDGFDQEPEVVWTWSLRQSFPERNHKPHGMTVQGERVLVTCFDYFTDSFVVSLDAETGEQLGMPMGSGAVQWAGDPELEKTRAAHNVAVDGDTYLVSDTHNHRLLGLNADWSFAWELNQETLGSEAAMRFSFSGVNDVERVQVEGQDRLLVSARGDYWNHVMLFAPDTPIRPQDPPWKPTWRWPQNDDRGVLHEAHNPRVIDGGFTVADSGNDRVRAVSWVGEEIWTVPGRGCPESEYDLDWPRDALLLSEDVLVIADSLGDKLMAVDIGATKCFNEATVLWTWTGLGGPYQVERL